MLGSSVAGFAYVYLSIVRPTGADALHAWKPVRAARIRRINRGEAPLSLSLTIAALLWLRT